MNVRDLEPWIAGAGLSPRPLPSLSIEQGPQIHASPLGIRQGATTVLALIGQQIADIWQAQTGRTQQIYIDTRHAEIAMGSAWLLKLDGDLATTRNAAGGPIEGGFPTADGRTLYFLCAFPGLTQQTADALGVEVSREAVAAAVHAKAADELEAIMVAHDLTGVIVRDYDTWLQHPQGQALKDQPTVVIERIGDAPPIPLPGGERPLSGLCVLDCTRVIAGPMGTRTLAEFGADVLQVSAPGLPDLLYTEADTAHAKRRTLLDLNTADGLAQIKELIRGADVFVQSYHPGSFARRGLGPADLAALRPGIIYVSESAYGHTGPWATKRGFDGNVQAATGIQAMHGPRDRGARGEDTPIPMAINDYGTGYWEAWGILEAVRRRATEGGSWLVRPALAQTAHWFLRMGSVNNPEAAMPVSEARALVAQFSDEADSAYGRMTRLRNPLQLSETPPTWATPTVKPGHHQPVWA